jgi:predicted nucleotidyltransferase
MLSSSIGRLLIGLGKMIATRKLSHNGDVITLDTLRAEMKEEILRLAERRGAHNLRVFGSVARGEANENSDLDLLNRASLVFADKTARARFRAATVRERLRRQLWRYF